MYVYNLLVMKRSLIILLGVLAAVNVLTGFVSSYTENPFFSFVEKYEKSIILEPDLQKAQTLITQKKWDQAIKLLLEYTKDYPTNAESWFYLASAYHGKKDYSKAINANQKSIAHSSRYSASAYYNIACAYSLSNQKEEAVASLTLAMENGFMDYDLLRNDTDIELLRKSGLVELPKRHSYQKITARNGIEFKYKIILPESYNKSNTYPAILAYPSGSQSETSADWALSEFWGADASKKGWIIVVPVAPSTGWINHPSHHALNDLLKLVKGNHHIEGGKFHMLGFAEGARAAATFALMSKQYFQSLTTISSYAWESWDAEDLASFKIMPVKMIVGEKDKHGMEVASRVKKSFDKYNVKSNLEVIANEGRNLPSLRNATVIEKLKGSIY